MLLIWRFAYIFCLYGGMHVQHAKACHWSVLCTLMSHMTSVYQIDINNDHISPSGESTVACSFQLDCHQQLAYFYIKKIIHDTLQVLYILRLSLVPQRLQLALQAEFIASKMGC